MKSITERNKARSMLAGAPLMVAQLGAIDLRKKLTTGNTEIIPGLNLEASSTMRQLLEQLKHAPPLAILKLCNKEVSDFITKNMMQHSADLDYVQEVLTTTGNHPELNPSMLAVLEAFNRRRNLGRFQLDHQSIDFDRLRFSHLASANDDNSLALSSSRASAVNTTTKRPGTCRFFQIRSGCRRPSQCQLLHKCAICGSRDHGVYHCNRKRSMGTTRIRKRSRNNAV